MKVIIVGAGEVGFHIAQRLVMENKEVVIIDKSADALKRIAEHIDVQTVEGSGSSPQVLEQAGVADADIILAVTDSDEINIIASIFANALSPESLKLARIRNEEYTLYREVLSNEALNIGMVINPEVEVVKTVERMIRVPGAVEYNEFARGKVCMVGIRVQGGPLVGKQLMDMAPEVRDMPFVIGAIVRNDELLIPTGKDKVHTRDLVYIVCETGELYNVLEIFGCKHRENKNVLIIGGGDIGLRLANVLDSSKYYTKLVEGDEKRCQELADKLDKVLVLKGDGTDKEFLTEENVGEMDVVVSMTGDEETNILSSLLAKSMGAAQTITRINKFAYLPLVQAIGIEHSVSTRLSAINSILHFVRKGKVFSTVSIKGDEAEALEALVEKDTPLVGKPLMELEFPKGSILLTIIRGEDVIIPHGSTVLQPEDRIIMLALRASIPEVEKVLTLKLEQV